MKYYIAVKLPFVGELYTVSGPYDSFEDAEANLDLEIMSWNDMLDEDEYLGIVSHEEESLEMKSPTVNNGSQDKSSYWDKGQTRVYKTTNKAKTQKNIRPERKNIYKKHWKALVLILIIIVLPLFIYCTYSEYQKTIRVGVSSTDLIGKKFSAVEKTLTASGFTNIHHNILQDLEITNLNKEGIVTNICIRGENEFSESSRYPYDVKIEITYHLIKKIRAPISSKEAKKLDNYKDLEILFRNAGFVNIVNEAEYDLITGWITGEDLVESVSIGDDMSFDEQDSYRPDVKVLIKYHAFSKNSNED